MTILSEDTYRCLFQNMHDGVVVSDKSGTITSCNASFVRLIGRTPEKIVGSQLSSLVDFEHPEPRASEKETDTTGSTDTPTDSSESKTHLPHPATILTDSGMEVIMPATIIPIHDAESNSHKNTDGQITVIYIVQSNTVQQAQTEFVSTVSHELRTPLTSIKGFADTILRAGERLEPTQQRRYVGIIKDQADRLTRLVEDLLAVSRLESKKLQLTIRAIDFNEAVQRVQRNLSDRTGNHRIVVNIPAGLPPIWADADRLEQILTNLLDNAIKYSLPNTTVTVTARDLDISPELVEFSVSDQGVGIPEEHLSKIFTKFSRIDNPLVRQTEGTGLGLYITRSLVLALGGQIKVESSPGNTTFTVQLPAATLEEQAARGRR